MTVGKMQDPLYYELKSGRSLDPRTDTGHNVTLYKNSFGELYEKGLLLAPMKTTIIRCPRALSVPLIKEGSREVRRAAKMICLRKYFPPQMRQMICELRSGDDKEMK